MRVALHEHGGVFARLGRGGAHGFGGADHVADLARGEDAGAERRRHLVAASHRDLRGRREPRRLGERGGDAVGEVGGFSMTVRDDLRQAGPASWRELRVGDAHLQVVGTVRVPARGEEFTARLYTLLEAIRAQAEAQFAYNEQTNIPAGITKPEELLRVTRD